MQSTSPHHTATDPSYESQTLSRFKNLATLQKCIEEGKINESDIEYFEIVGKKYELLVNTEEIYDLTKKEKDSNVKKSNNVVNKNTKKTENDYAVKIPNIPEGTIQNEKWEILCKRVKGKGCNEYKGYNEYIKKDERGNIHKDLALNCIDCRNIHNANKRANRLAICKTCGNPFSKKSSINPRTKKPYKNCDGCRKNKKV